MTNGRVVSVLVGVMAAFVLPRAQARACSVTHLPPTNYELITAAERIVVVRAPAAPTGKKQGDNEMSPIAMKVERVLKGAPATPGGEVITVSGNFDYLGRSERNRLDTPRPGVMRGMCVAWDYKADATFVLMLKKIGGAWVLEARPLSRSNEEIEPTGDVWETLITTYVKLGKLPKKKAAAERARLIARSKTAAATEEEKLIGKDLEVDALSKPARR